MKRIDHTVEKWTRKVVPHAVDLLVTPFVTVIVTGFVAFIAIGPLGRALGSGITVALSPTLCDIRH